MTEGYGLNTSALSGKVTRDGITIDVRSTT